MLDTAFLTYGWRCSFDFFLWRCLAWISSSQGWNWCHIGISHIQYLLLQRDFGDWKMSSSWIFCSSLRFLVVKDFISFKFCHLPFWLKTHMIVLLLFQVFVPEVASDLSCHPEPDTFNVGRSIPFLLKYQIGSCLWRPLWPKQWAWICRINSCWDIWILASWVSEGQGFN